MDRQLEAPKPAAAARWRIREELTREILDAGRRQLAQVGSAGLSLRAVARDVGMVSSAVYRYFPSRDALLTALIIEAYSAVGSAAERAETLVPRTDLGGRWLATARAARSWALEHPHEYSLIFGSPVPGYRAPSDTVDPAARIPLLLMRILLDAEAAGYTPPAEGLALAPSVLADLSALRAAVAPALTEAQLARAVMAWTQLIGSISFEAFGHLHNVIHDYPGYFDHQMRAIARDLALPSD